MNLYYSITFCQWKLETNITTDKEIDLQPETVYGSRSNLFRTALWSYLRFVDGGGKSTVTVQVSFFRLEKHDGIEKFQVYLQFSALKLTSTDCDCGDYPELMNYKKEKSRFSFQKMAMK